MELISLGIIPEELLEDEAAIRQWVLRECEDLPFLTGYPHKPTPTAVCLRVALTGEDGNPNNPRRHVTVCDLVCDSDHEGLPVTYHDLGGEESFLA